MDYDYTGEGEIVFHGCPEVESAQSYVSQFAVGTLAYDVISARKGRLEPIAIRKIIFRLRGYKNIPLYIDTLNGRYNDIDLVTHTEAVALATAYYQKKLDSVNAAIDKLNC